jgi:hypothetical protein
VIPSEGRPRVPPTSTIAPGHQPVYLVIFGNHDDQPGPNHWGFYIPYPKDGEVGTVISANVVLGKWKVQFSRNYMPDVSRRGLWFFYLGQVSQASVSDYSHLPGRTLFNDPDGELEEVTRAIPLPRSELKVSFALDNTILSPGALTNEENRAGEKPSLTVNGG